MISFAKTLSKSKNEFLVGLNNTNSKTWARNEYTRTSEKVVFLMVLATRCCVQLACEQPLRDVVILIDLYVGPVNTLLKKCLQLHRLM